MSHQKAFDELIAASDSTLAANAFFSLAEAIPQLVWSSNADGRCEYVNRRWLEFTGSAPSDILGHDWTRFMHSDDLPVAVSSLRTATELRTEFEVECRLRSKTGDYRWFLVRSVPLVEDPDVLRWLSTSTDIHDKRQPTSPPEAESFAELHHDKEDLERQVELRTQQLRETITQLEAFAYSLAHDMRAPCRALTNYSQILLRDYSAGLAKEPRNFLYRISRAAERLDSFVRDLLVYSRVAHDKMPIENVDVEQILTDVIMSSPNFQPPLAELNIRSPFHSVSANDTLLAQCLTNLLTNACKFVKKGEKPLIHIYDERHGDLVHIYIEDNGIGISENDQERIFNVFERLNHEKDFSGTGVGLSIVRKAVERMGGAVGVSSKPGEGARFWLELKATPTTV